MEQSKNFEQFHYNATENRNDALGASNQRFLQDPSSSVNTNSRPPDLNQSGVTKPVNYSIQTGEEFALEFMRERSIPKRPNIPNVVGDSSNATTYMDLKGILGISHTGSDSGSEISMFSTVEKGRVKDFEKKGSYGNENRAYYESVRSIPRSSSRNGASQGLSYGYPSLGSTDSLSKIKFLCSFGGKILPRPSDGRLRYVGGETRIIQISKAISWQELLQKTMLMYNQAHTIKYQLPGEDLDALVSVSCDEDLQNMIEECNVLEDGGRSQKPRMFLVSSSELDDPHFGMGSLDGDSEVQYVVAVNGMDLGTKRNSSGQLASTSANDLDQLLSLNTESDTVRTARESAGTNAFPFASTPLPPTTTKHIPTEGLSSAISVPEKGVSFFDSKSKAMQEEPVRVLLPSDAVNSGQTHKSNDGDHGNIFSGATNVGYTGSEADSTDFGYEPGPPQRVFHSERVPHKHAEPELQNRLSKSDDNFGSQFLLSHSRSGMSQQESITETGDKSSGSNLPPHMEPSAPLEQPLPAPTVEEGLMQFDRYKELANTISNPISHDPRSELKSFDLNTSGIITDDAKSSGIDPSANEAHKQCEDPASSLPEVNWGEIASNVTDSNNVTDPAISSAPAGVAIKDVPRVGISAPKRDGDILIDINDRFPRDFLSDIFSRERLAEDFSSIGPLYSDGAGLSLNMENQDPKHWSFFQNLAQNEFGRKDVSLMDQDHLGYPSPLTTVEEAASRAYNFSPLKMGAGGLGPADSQLHFEDKTQPEPSVKVEADIIDESRDFNPSEVKGSDFTQFDVMSFSKTEENLGTPESDYEDGKSGLGDFRGLINSSLGEFDSSTLQLINNDDLEELKELGSGTFGTVYHGKWRGTDVAIKRIKKSCFTGRSSEQERLTLEFWREADILSKLHHPNVVAFYGVVRDGPGATMATVTEFMVNGSLRHVLLRKDKNLDRRKRLIIAMDAAFGMEYLHSKNIVHFDLKCDNLLVNLKDPHRPICKVGDFGLSKIKRNTLVTGGVRGTLPWMAPELLNGSSSKVSEKVDVFSFGIVLWEILTGEEPYANMHYGAIIGGIVSNTLRPLVPSFCDSEWKRLMEQCWAPDPVVRPSFTEIASRLRVMSSKPPTQANK